MLNNDIKTLSSDFPSKFPNLAVLHLSGSTWHCDASLRWLRNWLLATSVHVQHRDDNLCLTPHAVFDRVITSLTDTDIASMPSFADVLMTPATTTSSRLDYVAGKTKLSSGKYPTTSSRKPLQKSSKAVGRKSDSNASGTSGYMNREISDTDQLEMPFVSSSSKRSSVNMDHSDLSAVQVSTPATKKVSRFPTWEEFLGQLTDFDAVINIKIPSSQSGILAPLSPTEATGGRQLSGPELRRYDSDEQPQSMTFTPVKATTRRLDHTYIIFVMITIVAVTLLLAVIMILFIVRLWGRGRQKMGSEGGGALRRASDSVMLAEYSTSKTSSGVVNILIKSNTQRAIDRPLQCSSSRYSSDSLLDENRLSADVMALVPGRDINHEGPLRMYKWQDF